MDQPRVSVIIPVKNEERILGQCIAALRASDVHGLEIVVADDHSTDRSAEVAAAAGARVVSVEGTHGVSAARNAGAAAARGEILVFTDADVVFPHGALDRLLDCVSVPGVDAAVGVMAPNVPFSNFASLWKNQWMRYTYRRMPDQVALFFTSVAAIRAQAFHASGGFDERYSVPSVEDTAFGRKLADLGCDIRLCRDAEVVHHKRYTPAGALAVDFCRARALVRLALREWTAGPRGGGRAPRKQFSVPVLYPLGAFALCASVALIPVSVLARSAPLLAAAAVLWFFAFSTSVEFLAHMHREHGLAMFIQGQLFWIADCAAITLGALAGATGFVAGKRY